MQVFFFFFFFSFRLCILVRQTEDGTLQLYCYLSRSPVLSRPCGLSSPRHVFGATLLWSPPEQWHIHLFYRPCENSTAVCFLSVRSEILNYDKEPLSLRLRGCCSWCRFALLRNLKEQNERGDWESNGFKVNYCNLWDEEDCRVWVFCLVLFSWGFSSVQWNANNGWKWVSLCCSVA